ncbi:hypothetical protein CJ468_05323 [Nocardia farcinica]|nr:hypothetical protein CJ468_05323 [Nocardia farcinica]
MICNTGREPAMSAATQIRPVGPAASEKPAISTAIAAGSSRPVAIARSIEHQVSSAPAAISGSGRRPLS